MNELRRILKEAGLTSLYVTHDQQEAFAIADRVVIMNAGRVEQTGAPQEVYRQPASAWVARFLGLTNLLSGKVRADGSIETPIGILRLDGFHPHRNRVTVLIRPDAAIVTDDRNDDAIEGKLVEQSFRGGHTQAVVRVGETHLVFEFGASANLPDIGRTIRFILKPDAVSPLSDPGDK
jgi:ABC-type Fe3+/spermidine/putrescine transport system ATPase subunit